VFKVLKDHKVHKVIQHQVYLDHKVYKVLKELKALLVHQVQPGHRVYKAHLDLRHRVTKDLKVIKVNLELKAQQQAHKGHRDHKDISGHHQ
jgi:hypothetical protein